MYKTLVVSAVLVAAFAAVADRSDAVLAATPASAQIVANVSLKGQTQTIPATTIFNVTQGGLYRVTTYATQTVAGTSSSEIIVDVNYTDGAGMETYDATVLSGPQVPPNAYGTPGGNGIPANSFTFSAVSGTPISFSAFGPVAGTYDLFIVVERLV